MYMCTCSVYAELDIGAILWLNGTPSFPKAGLVLYSVCIGWSTQNIYTHVTCIIHWIAEIVGRRTSVTYCSYMNCSPPFHALANITKGCTCKLTWCFTWFTHNTKISVIPSYNIGTSQTHLLLTDSVTEMHVHVVHLQSHIDVYVIIKSGTN